MRSDWIATRPAKILLLGIVVVLLQQVSIPYQFVLGDATAANASLIHLHAGFLLAVAMLERDRGVVAGVITFDALSWLVRAWLMDYQPAELAMGMALAVLIFGWALLCARWLGWPRAPTQQQVSPRDVLRFALIGLLLYPMGFVVLNVVGFSLSSADSPDEIASRLVQVYFAKHFGVAVLTLPLVVGWTERDRRGRTSTLQAGWVLVLAALLALSVWLTRLVGAGIGDATPLVLMDYRIVLVAIVGWCMLNLRMSLAMLLLSAALFLLVRSLADTAQQTGTLVGAINLAHLGVEIGILSTGLLYYTLSARDRDRLQKRILEDAHRDSITGLPNYNALREQPEARRGASGEIGYLLLDQADALAVGFGLQAQASVMGTVAARLAGTMRPYYLGTGQFALLPDGELQDAAWDAVLGSIERMDHVVGGRRVRMTPYLGVVAFGKSGGGDVEYALLSASNLAYEARRRNEVKPLYADVSHSTLRREEQRKLHDAADAIASLRAGRLLLYFQSISPIDGSRGDGAIRGEVLCRLLGEDGEIIAPNRFVDTIEASRRGPELDLAVVAALFRELRAHPAAIARCESISINLTGQSLSSDGFHSRLESLLQRSPIALSCLCFEITETAAISNREGAGRFLQALRDKGCRIAIDDFGAGMQSFSRLRDLPFDIIKIDGSFVSNMLNDRRDFEVVQASVAVARASGADVVAEFVENEATAKRLREMDVRWGQGFLYSRPRPLKEILAAAG